MLYAATAVNLNIDDQLACVKNSQCVNCSGDYPANTKFQWEEEEQILKIKCENNTSFPDAPKQYEQFYTG